MKLENNEINERYVRKDVEGGYLYNKSEISYFKEVQKLDVANNLMLGDYNVNGVYTLNAELIEQLVNMTKVYQYSFGTNMFCQSCSDFGQFGKIDFAIKIVKDTPKRGHTSAILQLLEPVDKANGYYTNTNIAQIKIYSAPESSSFVVDALKKFNVVSKKDAGLIKKKPDENYELIIQRKNYELMRKNLLVDSTEDIYKNSFNRKLKLLSKSPVGKKIIDEFNKKSYNLNGWFVKEGTKGYYKAMNEILQSVIECNKEELMGDVKLTAALNKEQNDCSKLLRSMIDAVDLKIVDSQQMKNNVELLNINKLQKEMQEKNQNSTINVTESERKVKDIPEKVEIKNLQPKFTKLSDGKINKTKTRPDEKKLNALVNTTEEKGKRKDKLEELENEKRIGKIENLEEERSM